MGGVERSGMDHGYLSHRSGPHKKLRLCTAVAVLTNQRLKSDSITLEGANPKLQAPNPNHSQQPNPKPISKPAAEKAPLGVGSWEFVGNWDLGVVGAWSLELGI